MIETWRHLEYLTPLKVLLFILQRPTKGDVVDVLVVDALLFTTSDRGVVKPYSYAAFFG